jgi:hypothetical protein
MFFFLLSLNIRNPQVLNHLGRLRFYQWANQEKRYLLVFLFLKTLTSILICSCKKGEASLFHEPCKKAFDGEEEGPTEMEASF